jgi:hypothetical protein
MQWQFRDERNKSDKLNGFKKVIESYPNSSSPQIVNIKKEMKSYGFIEVGTELTDQILRRLFISFGITVLWLGLTYQLESV